MIVLRALLTALLYGAAGTVVTVICYGVLQAYLGAAPARRSLDGMIAFFDLVLVTAIAFAVGGLIASFIAGRNLPPWTSAAAATVAALVLALILAPSFAVRSFYAAGLLAGALVAAGATSACRLLRPAAGRQDVEQ
jgi:hypothetical protein